MSTLKERKKYYKKAKVNKNPLMDLLVDKNQDLYMLSVVCNNDLKKMRKMYKELKKDSAMEIKATT